MHGDIHRDHAEEEPRAYCDDVMEGSPDDSEPREREEDCPHDNDSDYVHIEWSLIHTCIIARNMGTREIYFFACIANRKLEYEMKKAARTPTQLSQKGTGHPAMATLTPRTRRKRWARPTMPMMMPTSMKNFFCESDGACISACQP